MRPHRAIGGLGITNGGCLRVRVVPAAAGMASRLTFLTVICMCPLSMYHSANCKCIKAAEIRICGHLRAYGGLRGSVGSQRFQGCVESMSACPLSRCMCAQSATLCLPVYPPVCLPVFVADRLSNNRSGTHENHWHSQEDADEL